MAFLGLSKKPHKGTINNWRKIPCINGDTGQITFYVIGTVNRHPQFGYTYSFSTSWVVNQYGDEIETNNSRYTLGTPRAE